MLELASGSGEHAVCFQRRFHLLWQASDPDPDHRASIDAWIQHQGLGQVMPFALDLDVGQRPWPLSREMRSAVKAVVCINLLHISPVHCTTAVLEESALLLPSGAPLIVYGPFMRDGAHTSESNADFDQALRERNPQWGLRDLTVLTSIAAGSGLKLDDVVAMPANNMTLVLRRV